ncbi:MAG TPA: hypothetical protein PK280_17580 [Planctomycetota bacterium]|nr:hypothetical protein [Planctomycetota bacterium]
MKTAKNNQAIPRFTHLSRAWYGPANLPALRKDGIVDQVTFGLYFADGGCDAEMCMSWHWLVGNEAGVARIEAFADSFALFARPELKRVFGRLARLAKDAADRMAPAGFCALLAECGFEDATPVRR